jgi:hypothetical protein
LQYRFEVRVLLEKLSLICDNPERVQFSGGVSGFQTFEVKILCP